MLCAVAARISALAPDATVTAPLDPSLAWTLASGSMSELVCVTLTSLSAAAFLLIACGTARPASPPVASVVLPTPEEGQRGDGSAGDTKLECESEGTWGSSTPGE